MSDENPFASPTASGFEAPVQSAGPGELPIASQGKRFINLIVDWFAVQVFAFIAGIFLGLFMAPAIQQSKDAEAQMEIIGFILGLLVYVLYFFLMEVAFQQTIAKFMTGTKVVNTEGEPPSFNQLLGRSFARMVPFEAFSFLGSKNPVGWHDSWSGTRVVNTR